MDPNEVYPDFLPERGGEINGTQTMVGEVRMDAKVVLDQAPETEIISQQTIDRAIAAAKKVYPDRQLPAAPSVREVEAAFSTKEQKKAIAELLGPTLCLMQVKNDDSIPRWQPVLVDGLPEMPLEEGAKGKTLAERIMAMREKQEGSPQCRGELTKELYDLLGHAAEERGTPISWRSWTILSAGWSAEDKSFLCANWDRGRPYSADVSTRGVDDDNFQLRSAVFGNVIS